jgi:hypothetical protein
MSKAIEIEMKNFSSSSNINKNMTATLQTCQITKIVKCCKYCHMVFIGESKRILCPFCGSFYEPKNDQVKGDKRDLANNEVKKNFVNFLSLLLL